MASAPENEVKGREETIKEGIMEKDGVLVVSGEDYIYRVCSALASPTRIRILIELLRREADIGEIADMIGQSKANASTQVRRLEEIGLVRSEYKPGVRGVRKVAKTTVREIRIVLAPPEQEEQQH
ncbi:ArsR/SmtB family transcription factor [Hyperthermus butylicus]|uniref:Transcriptional regulator, HTH-type n=1 Tax=Hyperthermus butylicus (strain DSM 5456 / JCM 9403 / PLM1-5) TaxID=415426 RepID=A2BIY9_HYPBU|nr:ArsR family transcriptional regulator [Hyperthermus butylicus]ABM79950.1 transcriptional regulator, HTH-type [Hyperthermus butylicus DSM 5456]